MFLPHFSDDTPILYHNLKGEFFDDLTSAAGLAVNTNYVCWGVGFADLDNDGWLDILHVTGTVYPEVEKVYPDYKYKTQRVVYRNLGNGSFEEVSDLCGAAILERHSSRGCAFGDFDNDGDMDVLIMNMNEPPSLLRNDVDPKQHWVKVKLEGVKSNRSAIGARVIAHYGGKKQVQAVVSQSSYYSCNDSRLHFGLGAADRVDLEVFWPNGVREAFKAIAADQLVTVREGVGRVANKGWSGA